MPVGGPRSSLRKISQGTRLPRVNSPDPGGGKSPGPMRYAGLGVQLAVSMVVFVLAGQWLDKRLGNTGMVTVAAAFLGFGGTMYSLIRALNRKDGGEE